MEMHFIHIFPDSVTSSERGAIKYVKTHEDGPD